MSVRLYEREAVGNRFADGSDFALIGDFESAEPNSVRFQTAVSDIRERGNAWLALWPARRYVGKCRDCKRGHSALVDTIRQTRQVYGRTVESFLAAAVQITDPRVSVEDGVRVECECGRSVLLTRVKGVHNPDVGCDARCMNATGPNCECSCNGANHGAAYG